MIAFLIFLVVGATAFGWLFGGEKWAMYFGGTMIVTLIVISCVILGGLFWWVAGMPGVYAWIGCIFFGCLIGFASLCVDRGDSVRVNPAPKPIKMQANTATTPPYSVYPPRPTPPSPAPATIIVVCKNCNQKNRVPSARLADAVCARCRQPY